MRWLSHSKIFRTWKIVLLTCSGPLIAQEWQAQSEEEALFLRRIADFWKEGEYQIVKSQIEEFLCEYPESSFTETLHASLGDLYVRDGSYKNALMQYARIVDPVLSEKIFLNRMQCLLELQWFATLADECEAYLLQDGLSAENKVRATHLLAVSLYQQCLNSSNDPEALKRLASRALPYFQELLNGGLSEDIAQASAHLCVILENYSGAAEIYLHLANASGTDREEMLFQAALFQAKFDKPLALKTFRGLVEDGRSCASDAAYNALVLAYDCKEYEEILSKKEAISVQIPPEKGSAAHLFFGKSHMQLKQYPEALRELLAFAQCTEPSDALCSALVDILDASYRLDEAEILKEALDRFAALYPKHPQLPKGYLSQALLEKKLSRSASARSLFQKIQFQFPEAPECTAALFEEIHLDFHENLWKDCRERCANFLSRYPNADAAPFVWHFFASASSNLCSASPARDLQEQFIRDLELFLAQTGLLSEEEKGNWILLQAKTFYDLKRYGEAVSSLEKLPQQNGNKHLLLALSYRDGFQDAKRFCIEAESALSLDANLLDRTDIHLALFNSYLDQGELLSAADHLYQAAKKTDILPENLLWLADYYDREKLYPERAVFALEAFFTVSGIDTNRLEEKSLVFEKTLLKLSELYGKTEEGQKQLAILESLKMQQEEHPSWSWQEESAIELLLAEQYEKMGQSDRALGLYDRLTAKSSTLSTFASAIAALKGSRLRIAKLDSLPQPELMKLLIQLKTLSLQKNLANEPVHLEAAIEYIDLQSQIEKGEMSLEKRLALLNFAKENFEKEDDLLSSDYHAGRRQSQEKEALYRGYLTLFQAEILQCRFLLSKEEDRSHLLQNAKKLYEEILLNPPTPYLAVRAQRQLELMTQ